MFSPLPLCSSGPAQVEAQPFRSTYAAASLSGDPLMQTTRPFFIVGSPRSGTTLLQAMLMSIPGVYIPPETKFWPASKGRAGSFGSLSTERGFRLAVESILKTARESEVPLDESALCARWEAGERSYAAMFDALLAHVQERREGCRRIGEKSPPHLLYVPELLEAFPDGKVITIIRDGRDVSISQAQAWKSNVLRVAISWRRDQALHRSYAQRFPAERYTSVRYEDLVTHPEPELRRLCEFLGEEFTPDLLEHHKRSDTGFARREKHKARTLEPVTSARISRYRESLSRPEIALFQLIAGKELQRQGYELDPVPRLLGLVQAVRLLPATLHSHRRRRRLVREMKREVEAK